MAGQRIDRQEGAVQLFNGVARWLDKYYKEDRLNRPGGTREKIIKDRALDLVLYGHTLISRHDSVTGKAEWLIGHRPGELAETDAGFDGEDFVPAVPKGKK